MKKATGIAAFVAGILAVVFTGVFGGYGAFVFTKEEKEG